MKKLFIVISSVLLVSGCASIGTQFTKMSEPESGDRARIRVSANMLVKGVPNSECIDWSKSGAGTIFGGLVGSKGYRGRSLGMPNPSGHKMKNSGEFYAAANQPIAIALVNTPESRHKCSVSGTFIPQSGKDYQIELATGQAGIAKSICTMQLREITADNQLLPVTIKEAWCH